MPPRHFKIALALMLLATLSASAHDWKDATGSFNIKGEFLSLKQGLVYIEKTDGKIIKVPIEKLSAADQEFVRGQSGEKTEESPFVEASPSGNDSPKSEKPKSTSSTKTKSDSGSEKPPGNSNVITLSVPDDNATGEVRRFRDLGWGVNSFAFSPDGRYLAAGKMDRALLVFDVQAGKRIEIHDKLDTSSQIDSCRFSPDGKWLVSGGSTGRCIAWSCNKGHLEPVKQFGGHTGGIVSLAFSPDSQFVLSGGKDKKACYWNCSTAAEIYSFEGFDRDVKGVWISPTGKIGVISDGTSAKLVDLTAGTVKGTMKLSDSYPQDVAISPDGKYIAVADGYTVKQWDTKTGGERAILKDNTVQWTCEYSPNSKYLVSGASQLNLYDIDSGKRIGVFDVASSGYIQAIAISPDGRHVAAIPSSAGQDIVIIRMQKLD